MIEEIWRPVVGYEETYDVSNLGRIRRNRAGRGTRAGRLLTLRAYKGTGYLITNFTRDCVMHTVKVHQVVAAAFLPPQPSLLHEINHIDFNRLNAAASNLEWVTRKENHAHSRRAGRTKNPPRHVGQDHPMAKLSAEQVEHIRAVVAACGGRRGIRAELARQYGVRRQTIGQITRGENWQ